MVQGTLPTRLRVLRAERGLSLRAAAEVVGLRPATLSSLERGQRTPHDVTLAKIAQGYGVEIMDLMEEPVLLGKAEAPEAAGPPDEKERRTTRVDPWFLQEQTERIKRIKREREAEIEWVERKGRLPRIEWVEGKSGLPRTEWIFQMEVVDEHFERMDQDNGITAHAEEVKAGRELEEPSVDLPYLEFEREFSDLLKLTDKAKVLARQADLDIDVKVVKGRAEVDRDLDRDLHGTLPEQRG